MTYINKQHTRKAFTLIEILLYMTIVVIFVNSLVLFALNVMDLSSKSKQQNLVNATAQYLSEKISYEIRNASDINFASSDFGTDLATNGGKKLSLSNPSPNNPTAFDVENNRIRLTQGSSINFLMPATVKVTSLIFDNNSSSGNETKNISFTFTVQAVNPSRGNSYAVTTIIGAAELRSN